MRKWLLLAAAISCEVTASLSLKGALDAPALYVVVVAGYVASFAFLALVLRAGLPLGVAYGIWGALGVALTALLSALLFAEPLTALMGLGMVLIIGGVLLVELGSQRAHDRAVRAQERAQASGAGGGVHLMLGWLFLAGAIVSEVGGTLSLRKTVDGSRLWYLPVVVGYVTAFTLLSLTLAQGVPLGVAYGIWAAVGVALTAVLSHYLFKEPFTWMMAAAIALIGAGVLLVELGAAHGA